MTAPICCDHGLSLLPAFTGDDGILENSENTQPATPLEMTLASADEFEDIRDIVQADAACVMPVSRFMNVYTGRRKV